MYYPGYRNANSNATAKQAAAIKPDDAYDRWYHMDTSMKLDGRTSRVSLMVADFISGEFDDGLFVVILDNV
jgi:hypothetical protein